MVDPNTRQGKRTPVTLKIKFKSETLEQFIERYAVDVSQGGIFIRTKEPLAVGTQMRFEFQLKDASPLIAGEGTVVWTRENDPSRPAIAPGMGVRFDKLADGSQGVLEKILAEKAKQAPVRPSNDSPTKPPMFTDTPTVVAPLAVQDALLGDSPGGRKRPDSGKTPLPKPIPFHSDADEFPEEAFEEATKVRALDELIAQTAGNEAGEQTVAGQMPEPDEEDLAQRARTAPTDRAATDTTVDGPADRESAPVLPSPPSIDSASRPRLLDATPSPRTDEPSGPAFLPPNAEGAKTKPGIEPAKATTRTNTASSTNPPPVAAKEPSSRPSVPAARPAADPPAKKMPVAPQEKSNMAPTIIMLLLLVAAGGAGLWFFVLRGKAEESNKPTTVAKTNDPPKDPPVVNSGGGSNTPSTNPAVNNGTGSSGSAETPTNNATGSNGSAETPTNTGTGTGSGSDAIASTNPPNGTGSGSSEPANTGTGSGSSDAPPAVQTVDTYVGSSVPGSTVEIIGTRFAGNAPLRAKLERGRAYKARVSAPGYVAQELAFKGGDGRPTAKLEPKPRSIVISTEPVGALIFIDNANSGFTTPYTLELKGPTLTKKSIRLTLRKNGHKTFEKFLDLAAFKDDGTKLTATINEQLPVQVMVTPPPTGTNPKPPTGGEGSGATTPPAGGTDTPPPTGDGPKDGPKEPAGGAGGGGAPTNEPEPDFLK